MKTKERVDDKKGISLIVLVITIIVIIVLAVAVILSISNNNPIENARKARFLSDIKTMQEEVSLYIGKKYAETKGEYNPGTDNEIQNILENYPDYKDKVQIEDGKIVLIKDKVSDTEKAWASENGTKVINLPIPMGFEHIEGTVDTGYVIRNKSDLNEFVWIPVEVPEGKTFEETFAREDGYQNGKLQTFVSSKISTEPLDYEGIKASQSEIDEYNAMKASVQKYGGFYIARYEASDNGSGVAQSKKGQTSWTNINLGKSMTDLSGIAVEKARAVYPDNTSKKEGEAVSTLCYGVEWDATVRYLEKNYPGIKIDSTNYGNYRDSTFEYKNTNGTTKTKAQNSDIKVPTGSSEHNKTNNIYDMCGNVSELTMEAYNNLKGFSRGGAYNEFSTTSPVSHRSDCYTTLVNVNLGFRLALYIK